MHGFSAHTYSGKVEKQTTTFPSLDRVCRVAIYTHVRFRFIMAPVQWWNGITLLSNVGLGQDLQHMRWSDLLNAIGIGRVVQKVRRWAPNDDVYIVCSLLHI